jgi:hypothetical protein
MLTAAYPGGLFGDGPAQPYGAAVPPAGDFDPATVGFETPVDPAAVGFETPVNPAAVGFEAPVDPATVGFEAPVDPATVGFEAPVNPAAAGYGTSGYEAPVDPAAWQPADWRLLLTRGAKQLLGWFVGIGAVLWVAWIVVAAIIGSHSNNVISTSNAIHTVNAANNTLSSELNNYQNTVQACTNAGCVETADAQAATAFTNFASTLHGTPMPASAVAVANKVYSDATKVAQGLTQLSHLGPTISPAQYESTANSIGIGQALTQFQQDNNALADALNSSS